jgi:all-trans-retinol dehydrogenase (NAD+)
MDTPMFRGARAPLWARALSAQLVARRIVYAVQRSEHQVLMPWSVRLIPLGKALLPFWLAEKVCDWSGVSKSMTTFVGANEAEPGRTAQIHFEAG